MERGNIDTLECSPYIAEDMRRAAFPIRIRYMRGDGMFHIEHRSRIQCRRVKAHAATRAYFDLCATLSEPSQGSVVAGTDSSPVVRPVHSLGVSPGAAR